MKSIMHRALTMTLFLALLLSLAPVQPLTALAVPVEPKLNEFSASTAGTDVEYVEIFGTPNTDYSAYTVLEIEGDGSGSGIVDEVINLGTTNASGLYLVNLPANALENGSLTFLLVKTFSGALNSDLDTNNDGAFDVTPWDSIVDTVAVNDGTAGDLFYGTPVLGPNYDGISSFSPGGASRIPDGFDTDAATDWVRNDFDLAGIPGFTGTPDLGEAYNTPGAMNAVVMPQLVINEFDYDQPGTDATEFVEIRNDGASAVSLAGVTLELVNGNGGGAAVYDTIVLPNVSLAAGDYFVVCANAATVANCDLDDGPDTNFIQNGAPDAVGLRWNGNLIDAVSYEGDTGAPYTEGSGAGLVDDAVSATQGISRCPDGADTNQNNVDFTLTSITPGAANFCVDAAPEVSGTFPVNGATDFPVNNDLTVTFSEPVDVSSSWFSLVCSVSGPGGVPTTFSGGPTTFTLDPSIALTHGESCTLTVLADQVSDQDSNDPPDNMAANFTVGFSPFDVCATSFTPIYAIQGSGLSAAITGIVTTQGVVVGDFEGSTSVGGFFIQDPAGDGNPATSDGIFVYTGSSNLVSAGQVVRVTGFARERFNQTALNGSNSNSSTVTNIVQCGTGSVPATDVTMPFADANYPERYEGMYVRLPQSLVISEYFNYDRFGEIVLALPLDGEPRPFTGTAVDEPGADANARTLANSLSRITLDDANSAQNPAVLRHPNGDPFSLTNLFRGGDTVQNTVGVLGFDFSLYRIFPTGPADYTAANPRPAAPEPVGGSLRVASFNTLNYFLTLDPLDDSTTNDNPADNICGPTGTEHDCRGADLSQPSEFTRQRDKLLQALAGLDADIIGLNELENTLNVEPLADIVAGLPGYAYINTGVIGTDAIKVGLIYRPDRVIPFGNFQILDSSDDPRFLDSKSRPVLAQTFLDLATGGRFTVAVNHLKSKSSTCNDVGDPDTGDGQGNCSGTRTLAAQALVDWLATDPTGSGDSDFLIIGDLNSYAMEDPIDAVIAGPDDTVGTADDYTNLIAHFQGEFAYSYVFDGQFGYLDHALANPSMLAQVTGAADWHINSDEPDVLDYDTSFKPLEQEALYEPNGYRSSDHDPLVIGINPLQVPGESFITGGGWISSTAGKAEFSFDARYTRWATLPTGEFSFAAKSGFSFYSNSFDWLVVSGSTAYLKGTGTLNGAGSYSFLLVVEDGNPDTLQLKIWDGAGVLFDNGAAQALGGGQIKIHK